MKKIRAILNTLCLMFLCGCVVESSKMSEKQPVISSEQTLNQQIAESLGSFPLESPSRPVRGALVKDGDMESCLAAWGLAVGHLPLDTETVVVCISDNHVPTGKVWIPEGDAYSCAIGMLPADEKAISGLLRYGDIFSRQLLNAWQRERLELIVSLLKVRFQSVRIVPLFAGPHAGTKGVFSISLMRCLAQPSTVLFGVLPLEERPEAESDWLKKAHEFCEHGDQPSGVDLSAPELLTLFRLLAQGYALSPFDLQAKRRLTERTHGDNRHVAYSRMDCLTLLESMDTQPLMSQAASASWSDESFLRQLNACRGTVHGSLTGALLNHEEELILIDFVRKVLLCRLEKTQPPDVPQYSRSLLEHYGCIITLRRNGKVLGSVSQMPGNQVLPIVLVVNATKLTADKQHPITAEDVRMGQLEISIITPIKQLSFTTIDGLYRQLRPGRDGVYVKMNGKNAGILPVVWDSVQQDPRRFLTVICNRCGGTLRDFLKKDTIVGRFDVHTFSEDAPATQYHQH